MNGWRPAKRSDVPDVVLSSPMHARVVEIKGAQLIATDAFNAELTIRFPRVERLRPDKPAAEALSRRELLDIFRSGNGALGASSQATPGSFSSHSLGSFEIASGSYVGILEDSMREAHDSLPTLAPAVGTKRRRGVAAALAPRAARGRNADGTQSGSGVVRGTRQRM